jgi:hypothetical protein
MLRLVLTVEKHIVCCHLAWLRSVTPVLPLGLRRTKLMQLVGEKYSASRD